MRSDVKVRGRNGAVRQLPSGSWQARVAGESGNLVSIGVVDTELEAEDLLDKYNAGIKVASVVTPDDLLGVKEAARLLRYSQPYIQRLIDKDGFLEPFVELAIGPVWLREDVQRWKRDHPLRGW